MAERTGKVLDDIFWYNSTGTVVKPITSQDEFIETWNNMGKASTIPWVMEIGESGIYSEEIGAVALLYHANASTIQLNFPLDKDNLFEEDILALQDKDIKYFYLLGCNTASVQRSNFSNNIATNLSNKTGNSRLLASDGTTVHSMIFDYVIESASRKSWEEQARPGQTKNDGFVVYEGGQVVEHLGYRFNIGELITSLIPTEITFTA